MLKYYRDWKLKKLGLRYYEDYKVYEGLLEYKELFVYFYANEITTWEVFKARTIDNLISSLNLVDVYLSTTLGPLNEEDIRSANKVLWATNRKLNYHTLRYIILDMYNVPLCLITNSITSNTLH